MVMKNGKCIIFSAPSGAGKTTIVHYLLEQFSKQLSFSVSACSREKRGIEKEGEDYYYLSVDEFKQKIADDQFVEWEEVYADNFYGTLRTEIERIWELGKTVIFDVDVVGGLNLKKFFGDNALAVFVMPPNIETLELRLRTRSTETEESIARRIGKADTELRMASQFDKVILNDELKVALGEAETLISTFLNE
jgi:guanylate kinase